MVTKAEIELVAGNWLNLAFDGLEQETTETRLEAFMYQAKQYMKNKK